MVSNISQIVYQLFQKETLEEVSENELRYFVKQYPYAGTGHLLLAKKLQLAGEKRALERESAVAAIYFSNPAWLQYILNSDTLESAAANPVSFVENPVSFVENLTDDIGPRQIPEYNEDPVESEGLETEQQAVVLQAHEPVDTGAQPNAYTGVSAELTETAETLAPVAIMSEVPVATHATAAETESTIESTPGPTTEWTPEPAPETTTETRIETTPEAITEPATETTPEAITEPATETTAEAITEPATESTPEAITEPATESTPEAIIEPATESGTHIDTDRPTDTSTEVPAADATIASKETPIEFATETSAATSTHISPEVTLKSATENPSEAPAGSSSEHTSDTSAAAASREVQTSTVTPVEETLPGQQLPKRDADSPASQKIIAAGIAAKATITSGDLSKLEFDPYHTIDYFASQGIKLKLEDYSRDKLGQQLKSFTEWIRSMKRLPQQTAENSMNETDQHSIRRIAEHSVEEKEVLTESMAEVWVKQGNYEKARQIYRKLSLQNPSKSVYFAAKIEQLKVL